MKVKMKKVQNLILNRKMKPQMMMNFSEILEYSINLFIYKFIWYNKIQIYLFIFI